MNKKPSRPQVNPSTLKRLLGYLSVYKTRVIVVVICILLSAIANVMSSLFIQRLIDDYISPLLLEANPVFDALFRAIVQMACIYVIGILASLIYNRTMAVISQGILKKIRDDMFAHMQTLPIKYFDTHTHGDVMSHYTNDTDALRQMLSQSLPQLLSSCVINCCRVCLNVVSECMDDIVYRCFSFPHIKSCEIHCRKEQCLLY